MLGNNHTKMFISEDDARSFGVNGTLINNTDVLVFAMIEVAGD
jgi:hypothetical protein